MKRPTKAELIAAEENFYRLSRIERDARKQYGTIGTDGKYTPEFSKAQEDALKAYEDWQRIRRARGNI